MPLHNVHIITHYTSIDLITCIILLLPFSAVLDKMLVLKSNAEKKSLRTFFQFLELGEILQLIYFE